MAKRYFRAGIGYQACFRSSMKVRLSTDLRWRGLRFSTEPGLSPAVEITKPEFHALGAIRDERLVVKGLPSVALSGHGAGS